MISDTEEKENSEVATNDAKIDLACLLEAASNMNFQQDDGYTENKGEFEKASSLFDIVKKNSSDQEKVNSTGGDIKDENSDLNESINVNEDKVDKQELGDFDEETYNKLPDGNESDNTTSAIGLSKDGESLEEELEDQASKLEGDKNTETENDFLEDNREIPEEHDVSSDNNFDQISYDKGYQAALSEFEKTFEREKSDFLNVAKLLLEVGDDYQELIEDILREKTFGLVSEFLGRELDTNVEDFVSHIENCAKAVITKSTSFVLELNHADLITLQKYFANEKTNFELVENPQFNRGEFRIISDSSGYEQIMENK